MVTLEADKRETKAWRCLLTSFLNKLGSRLSLRVGMEERGVHQVYVEVLWTLVSREQSLKKKEKAYLFKASSSPHYISW